MSHRQVKFLQDSKELGFVANNGSIKFQVSNFQFLSKSQRMT